MIVVHHLNNSRSQRILWLLEELGLPYEIKFYKRDAQTNGAPEELKVVHPLGRSPSVIGRDTRKRDEDQDLRLGLRHIDGRLPTGLSQALAS